MFYRRFVLAAVLLMAACARKEEGPPPRFAVLRFENLTSDPSLNWMGRAASEILTAELGAVPSRAIYKANESFGRRPVGAPGVSSELTDSLLAGGNRIITGYFERVNGKLVFTAVEEDARTGRTVKSATAEGSILDACAGLARQFTEHPKAYGTRNEAALRDFMQGVEASSGSTRLYQEAVAADPKFAEAYLAWSEAAIELGDPAQASQILASARANQVGGAVLAKIEFAVATTNKDAPARMSALKRIVETDPNDASAVVALGEAEMAAHRFAEAAAVFAKGSSPDLINLRAYALMFSGDETKALAAVHEYQTARPQDANPIDSEGDIQFFFGHFKEAEKLYLRAAAKDPQFNQGSEAWKAARAHLMTGDVAGAAEIFKTYQQERIKANDPTIGFRSATWQYLTGDRKDVIASMQKVADQAPNPALKTLALTQAAIWELQTGQKLEALHDTETVLKMGQTSSSIAAVMVRFALVGNGPVAGLEEDAEHMFKGKTAEPLRRLAVGYALIFAKRYAEAVPFWKQLYEESNPNDQSFAFLYAMALKKSGQTAEAAPFLKFHQIPSVTLAPSFECLYLSPPGNTAAPAK